MRNPSPVLLVFVLWAAGLGAAAQFGKISVMFDLLGQRYPGAGPGIGLMVSLVGLVGLVFGATAGLLVQRIGLRRVLVGGLTLGAAMSLFQANLPGFGWMMLSRALEGASHLAIVVSGPVLIAQIAADRWQSAAMTLWASFFGVSFALTAWLGLPLAQAHGPAAVFLVHAAFMAAIALWLFRLLPPDRFTSPPAPLSPWSVLRQHAEIYASPFTSAPGLGFVFYTMMYVAILTLVPAMMPDGSRAVVATFMPLASIAVSLTLGTLVLRWVSAVRLVQIGLGLTAGFTLLLALSWGQTATVGVAMALGGTLGLIQGGSFASIPQLNPTSAARSRAAGVVAQMGNLGTTLGTPILAALIGWFGVWGLVLLVLPLCTAGIIVHIWLSARRLRES